jgi:energy-converting hydrogenase Eha subunit H
MALFVSGICGAGLLALGSHIIFPLDTTLSGVCNLIGIVSTVAFVGLLDGR